MHEKTTGSSAKSGSSCEISSTNSWCSVRVLAKARMSYVARVSLCATKGAYIINVAVPFAFLSCSLKCTCYFSQQQELVFGGNCLSTRIVSYLSTRGRLFFSSLCMLHEQLILPCPRDTPCKSFQGVCSRWQLVNA